MHNTSASGNFELDQNADQTLPGPSEENASHKVNSPNKISAGDRLTLVYWLMSGMPRVVIAKSSSEETGADDYLANAETGQTKSSASTEMSESYVEGPPSFSDHDMHTDIPSPSFALGILKEVDRIVNEKIRDDEK